MSIVQRFEAKYMPEPMSGCWLWTGSVVGSGYGSFSRGRRGEGNATAHRVSYELRHGPIPQGLYVLHKCDVKTCVNPDHLYLGTAQNNSSDMVARGRCIAPVGERNGNTKLTGNDVRRIRLDARPETQIAVDYGLSRSAVGKIKRRERWKSII